MKVINRESNKNVKKMKLLTSNLESDFILIIILAKKCFRR